MSSKHTKGPWVHVAVEGGWDGVAEETNRQSVICVLKHNNPANADLIAAAPELLEALTKAVKETEHFLFEAWLVRVCPSGDVEAVQRQWLASSDYCEFIDEWREQIDAIAKATGASAEPRVAPREEHPPCPGCLDTECNGECMENL